MLNMIYPFCTQIFSCLYANIKWESAAVMQWHGPHFLPNVNVHIHSEFHWDAALEEDFAQLTPEGLDFLSVLACCI